MWKNRGFFVWKNRGFFVLAILYWTVDSGQWTADSGQRTADSGQRTADSGQRTEVLSRTGQRDTEWAILYWTETARDSGHGGWTMDGTEWTEVLSLL